MKHNPPLKFQASLQTRRGLQNIADHHGIGGNETSANEVGKIVATAFGMVRPGSFYQALAALRPHQRTSSLQVFSDQLRPKKSP